MTTHAWKAMRDRAAWCGKTVGGEDVGMGTWDLADCEGCLLAGALWWDGYPSMNKTPARVLMKRRKARGAVAVHRRVASRVACGDAGTNERVSDTWGDVSCPACVVCGKADGYISTIYDDLFARCVGVAVDGSRYPHRCPRCAGAAFVGFNMVDCSGKCRP